MARKLAKPMVGVDDLVGRLERWLAANRPDYLAALQPATSDEALDAFQMRFSLELPDTFRALYRWRNGQPPSCSESLQLNRMLCSLEEIAEVKAMLDGMVDTDFEEPEWWRRGWVPFLSNGGGDYVCIDLAAEDGGQPGQVLTFWHNSADRDVRFASFAAWLADLVQSMDNGRLKWN